MCIIIDANQASNVFQNAVNDDFKPIIKWLFSKDGMMVYGGKLAEELAKVSSASHAIKVLQDAGHAQHFNDRDVNIEEQSIIRMKVCVSNDPHIIALARLTGARTLCSHDTLLHKDFKNTFLINKPKGCIYQEKSHTDLLGHTVSCQKNKYKNH